MARTDGEHGWGRFRPKSPSSVEEWAEYGVGEIIDHTPEGHPIYADYRVPKAIARRIRQDHVDDQPKVTWWDIVDHWNLVLSDLHEIYGADWDDPTLRRPWPWWRDRILGLLSTNSRLSRALSDT